MGDNRDTPTQAGFWASMPNATKAVAGLLTAGAAFIGALTAAGLVGGDDPPDTTTTSVAVTQATESTTIETQAPTVATVATAATVATPERTTVNLVYSGNNLPNCSLFVEIRIGDQVVVPSGLQFSVSNIQTGDVEYAVGGDISCLDGSGCQALGSGVITIRENQNLFIEWGVAADLSHCPVVLIPGV